MTTIILNLQAANSLGYGVFSCPLPLTTWQ